MTDLKPSPASTELEALLLLPPDDPLPTQIEQVDLFNIKITLARLNLEGLSGARGLELSAADRADKIAKVRGFLREMPGLVLSSNGSLRVGLPKSHRQYTGRYDALAADFGQPSIGAKTTLLNIPAQKIKDLQITERATQTRIDPEVHFRIGTSSDQPLVSFQMATDPEARLAYAPHPGSWYSFPLKTVQMQLVPDPADLA